MNAHARGRGSSGYIPTGWAELDAYIQPVATVPAPHRHYPHIRPLPLGWHRDLAGAWAPLGADGRQWEVLCDQCGDADGPADVQPPPARALRGPYHSKQRAKHAASRHRRGS